MTDVVIVCPHCKRSGTIECKVIGEGKPPMPVFATGGFHIEAGRLPDVESIVVCNDCDEIIVL